MSHNGNGICGQSKTCKGPRPVDGATPLCELSMSHLLTIVHGSPIIEAHVQEKVESLVVVSMASQPSGSISVDNWANTDITQPENTDDDQDAGPSERQLRLQLRSH